MADQKTVNIDRRHRDALTRLVDGGEADNDSEAARMLLDAGMTAYGLGSHGADTALRATIRRGADAVGLLTLLWVGLTYLTPLGFRQWAIPMGLVAVALYSADRALGRYEPGVSARLTGLVTGDRA